MRLIAAVLLVTGLCWMATAFRHALIPGWNAADASLDAQILSVDVDLQFNWILLALSTWTGALHGILLYLGVSGRLAQPEPAKSVIGEFSAQTGRPHQGDGRAAA